MQNCNCMPNAGDLGAWRAPNVSGVPVTLLLTTCWTALYRTIHPSQDTTHSPVVQLDKLQSLTVQTLLAPPRPLKVYQPSVSHHLSQAVFFVCRDLLRLVALYRTTQDCRAGLPRTGCTQALQHQRQARLGLPGVEAATPRAVPRVGRAARPLGGRSSTLGTRPARRHPLRAVLPQPAQGGMGRGERQDKHVASNVRTAKACIQLSMSSERRRDRAESNQE